MSKQLLLAIVLIVTLNATHITRAQNPVELSPEDADRVEVLLASMTLEEKVGQLFMVSIYGRELPEVGANLIRDYHPGAVSLFNHNTDYEPASQVALFINQMQTAATESGAGVPLIIALDQEGGDVRRIVNDVTKFPDPLGLGAITDMESIRNVGRVTGAELREIGVNMNLAPVADLYSREDLFFDSRVLHRRTFGDDPERVGMQVAAYSAGLGDAGVISVTKHFPGHGGTADSHLTLPYIDMEANAARSTALRSFEVAVQEGVPAVMVGHLVYTDLEPVPNLPASLSPTMNGILRDDFGFGGVVMTDAMDMAAIAANFWIPDAALMAVDAGMDMLVMGPNMSIPTQIASMQRIIDAVNNGEFNEDDLDERVRRVLTLKAQYGILDWQPADPETVSERIDLQAGQNALLEMYLDAATVVRDDAGLLPLATDEDVVIIYPASYLAIYNTCLDIAFDVTYFAYTFFPPDEEYNYVSRLGIDHAKVVIFVEDAFRNLRQRDLVNLLPPQRTVVVTLGSPFDIELFPEHSTVMAMYNSLPASHAAACHVLFGEHPALGRLPIAVADYPTGSGIDIGTE